MDKYVEPALPLFTAVFLSLAHATDHDTRALFHLPAIPPDTPINVMTYNMQMALGEYRQFWKSDTPPMPSIDGVRSTLDGITAMIRRENPDILILQEVEKYASIAYHTDQIWTLMQVFQNDYCYASTDYWNAPYIYSGRMNSAMQYHFVVLSKYKITQQRESILPGSTSYLSGLIYPQRKLFEVDITMQVSQPEMLQQYIGLSDHMPVKATFKISSPVKRKYRPQWLKNAKKTASSVNSEAL